MALQKLQQLPSGVEASYHRITRILLRVGEDAMVEVSSYLNEEARRDGRAPVSQETIRISNGASIINSPSGAISSAYTELKKSGVLSQAQDA
jgi:hypothetical protein